MQPLLDFRIRLVENRNIQKIEWIHRNGQQAINDDGENRGTYTIGIGTES